MQDNNHTQIYVIWGISGGVGAEVTRQLIKQHKPVLGYARSIDAVPDDVAGSSLVELRQFTISEDWYRNEAQRLTEGGYQIAGVIDCVGSTKTREHASLTERYTDVLEPNLLHPYLSTVLFSPLYRERASVVFVSSVRALTGTDNENVEYAFAKAALENLAKSLSQRLSPHYIRVNTVRPTPILGTHMSATWSTEMIAELKSRSIYGELVSPSQVASIIVFLLSDASSAISDTVIDVTNGFR